MDEALDKVSISADADSVAQAVSDLIEQNNLELPLLSQVATQVLALMRDEQADAAAFSKLVHRDQALAGHLLRIANSPAYLPRGKIVSLQQAITRLGTSLLADLAFAATVKGQVFNVPGQEQRVAWYWQHALATGCWAREIARIRRRNVESAFMCGLLHEIGAPVALKTITDAAAAQSVVLQEDELESLMQLFGKRIGLQLATAWNLPEPVVECIDYFSDYEAAPSFQQEALTVHLADRLATWSLDEQAFGSTAVLDSPATSLANLYPDEQQQLLDCRERVLEAVEAMSL